MSTIYFDMDGTIADFYNVENWLEYLISENPFPYVNATPLISTEIFTEICNRLQKRGFRIGIISWLSRGGSPEYNEIVTVAKNFWLEKYFPNICFDEIHIVEYGTPKEKFCKNENDILFDDEEKNRINWIGKAFTEKIILKILKNLLTNKE